jgi:replicative DNA helicase
VVFFSLEMSEEDVIERIHAMVLGVPLSSVSRVRRERAHRMWASSLKATLTIVDDQMVSPSTLASYAEPNTLLVVDYIGRMYTDDGTPAITEYQAMATISNEVKSVARRFDVPVLAAVQTNRTGTPKRVGSTHGIESLAQSIALGQDADLLVGINPYGRSTRLLEVLKNRRGPGGTKWYTKFEPEHGDFSVISAREAMDRYEAEDETELEQMVWSPQAERAVG